MDETDAEEQAAQNQARGESDDSGATPCLASPRPFAASSPSSSPQASDSDDGDSSDSSVADAEHLINRDSGAYHLRHESEPGRLKCGRTIGKKFRSAEFTAMYALDAYRCKKNHP